MNGIKLTIGYVRQWQQAEAEVRRTSDLAKLRRSELADLLDKAPEGVLIREESGEVWRKNADETWTCRCTPSIDGSGLGLLEEVGNIETIEYPAETL